MANVASWIAMLVVGTGFGLILGVNILFLPVWFFLMAGAVGVTADRASSWTCPNCHAEMYPTPEMEREIRGHRGGGASAPRGHRPAPVFARHHA